MNTVLDSSLDPLLDPSRYYSLVNWHTANREISAKIITELMYEELLNPEIVDNHYTLNFEPNIRYSFEVKNRHYFNFYRVVSASLTCFIDDKETPSIDAYHLIGCINKHLNVQPDTQAHAIREFSNTLLGDMHQLGSKRLSNAELLQQDEITIESQLVAHPWIIANKGRLGFSYQDYIHHAPEMGNTVNLLWLAVDKKHAQFNAIAALNYTQLINEELSASDRARFDALIASKGQTPSHYFYMPVHPWQWNNEIVSLFTPDIVNMNIILLGESHDTYQPQQSIRTLSNKTSPKKRYVKMPISILNTSVYRGLPSERVKVAPFLSDWLLNLVEKDDFLRNKTKLILLGEIASINFDHPIYSTMSNIPYQFNEKLAVIWRESIHTKIEAAERCIPLSSLMHRDVNNESFLKAIIDASGLTTQQWINQFLKAMLEPLLHMLYKYGFVFSPHGQNAMIILKDNIPTRLAVKDFVDDANLCVDPLEEHDSLPDELEDILEYIEGPILIQWIQSGLFVCVFRYLTEILEDDFNYSSDLFWESVYLTIRQYQQGFPELEERFDAFDLMRPVFPKLCLNRVRLLDDGYKDKTERPTAAVASMLQNPLFIAAQKYQQQEQEQEKNLQPSPYETV